jgi:hypothetical protein
MRSPKAAVQQAAVVRYMAMRGKTKGNKRNMIPVPDGELQNGW